MAQILFTIGGYQQRSYGVIVALAILLGTGVAYFLANDKAYRQHLLDVLLYGVLGAVIGARLWQVFFYEWPYYAQHPAEILMIWHGGLAIQGSIVGAVIVGLIYTWKQRISFWHLADIAAPGLIFGQAIGRIACFLNGDAFGSPTNSTFGLVYPPGTSAYAIYGSQPLWPAEVWEGQWDMVVFAVVLLMSRWRKWPQGIVFLTYITLYSIGRFSLEFLRGDGERYLFNWTAAQWSSASMLVLALICGIVLSWKSRHQQLPEAQGDLTV
ncbi:MAG: prolipoprotein diacylglyceryl transferase [Desulfitobacteriaceae bacterium]|nr:prolipoprotein diacylglyceryl transferase [Desulfitobacteriaceae bacterium]MDI6913525.1 prolipoprotein diacylglyceryl transferase [Desulfitobacteriaceae bacterium]